MEKRAVFRADASPRVGAGHVMRCLTLAGELGRRGWACAFASAEGTAAIVPAVAPLLAGEEAIAGADLLVVDHYGLDAGYEGAWRGHVGRIAVLDDLADRPHDCDLLLDQTWGRSDADYARLVPPGCRVLTGSRYSLLRPAFAERRAEALDRARQDVRSVVVSLGGTDPDNATRRVLDALAPLPVELDVVMGGGARHLAEIRETVAGMPRARLHVDVADMAALLACADLAIGAAGTSAWERCCLGLPTLLVVLADNQRLIAANLEQAGAARIVSHSAELDPAALVTTIEDLRTPGALARMSAAAAAICDGQGAARLCSAIEDLFVSKGSP